MKAFTIGQMNLAPKNLSKLEKEELKRKEEEKKTADVLKDFVASFEGGKSGVKTFVRGGVVNSGKSDEKQKGHLYTPKLKYPSLRDAEVKRTPSPLSAKSKPDRPTLKKKEDKKKSNLELFKEELKVMQQEREQRHAIKRARSSIGGNTPRRGGAGASSPPMRSSRFSNSDEVDDKLVAEFANDPSIIDDLLASNESNDPQTTNLFLGNVNPRMDEQQLCELFGKYGPLASVKVMWPRTDEERARERNCAFVAYMTRKDADRALRHLQGRDVQGFEMKLGWGKSVPVPPHPVYVPPVLLERTLPPPPSGLPFNAQPRDPAKKSPAPGVPPEFIDQRDFENTLQNSIVRVVVPTERNLLCLIHRMVEFVVREGPMFEAMIMNREINNPMFRFLFDNKSPAHIYYRWRAYSILQGDSPTNYRTKDFRLFKNGSLWRPPPINPYQGGLDDTDSEDELPYHKSAKVNQDTSSAKEEKGVKGELKEDDRDQLEDMLRSLLPRQKPVGSVMTFCLDHSDCSEEVVECITESMSILETPLTKKVARLYLISDILHNSSAKVQNASYYRRHFERKLEQVMKHLNSAHRAIQSRLRAEQFKQKVLACFRAWDDWAIYPDKYLIHLQNTFLGLVGGKEKPQEQAAEETMFVAPTAPVAPPTEDPIYTVGEDVDGTPIDFSNLDGNKLDEAAPVDETDQVDGMPLDGDPLDGVPIEAAPAKKAAPPPAASRFVQSKWETVDPDEVEAQAMTTSKWDQLEGNDVDGEPLQDDQEGGQGGKDSKEEISAEVAEARRIRLREIEVKVMKFQDELELGERERKPGVSISRQVQMYREKLMERETEKEGKEREKKDSKRKIEPDSRSNTPKKNTKSSRGGSSSESSTSSSDRHRKKRRKKGRESTSNTPRRGLVTYDSDDSSDDERSRKHHSSSKKSKKNARGRSRSRSPRRRSSAASSSRRRESLQKSKRSRSRSREKKKKRKSKH